MTLTSTLYTPYFLPCFSAGCLFFFFNFAFLSTGFVFARGFAELPAPDPVLEFHATSSLSLMLQLGFRSFVVTAPFSNHTQCCTFDSVMFASRIVLFNRWSRSHGVSPSIIAISLNLMIYCVSSFVRLNSFFNLARIFFVPTFGWSLEYFIYHVNARSYSMLTRVAFWCYRP